jgi:cob(I)alamin adenosyltransferase
MVEQKNKPWPRACLQVYTGDGKGKTTAAFGLAVRAAGRGFKIFIGQFMKGSEYGELEGAAMLGGLVKVEQFGSPECIPRREEPHPEDVDLARAGLKRAKEVIMSREYPIVILDEVNVAVYFHLIDEADLLSLVDTKPPDMELICTGRYAPEALIERADLVTEMKAIKHPFDTLKLGARDGIER